MLTGDEKFRDLSQQRSRTVISNQVANKLGRMGIGTVGELLEKVKSEQMSLDFLVKEKSMGSISVLELRTFLLIFCGVRCSVRIEGEPSTEDLTRLIRHTCEGIPQIWEKIRGSNCPSKILEEAGIISNYLPAIYAKLFEFRRDVRYILDIQSPLTDYWAIGELSPLLLRQLTNSGLTTPKSIIEYMETHGGNIALGQIDSIGKQRAAQCLEFLQRLFKYQPMPEIVKGNVVLVALGIKLGAAGITIDNLLGVQDPSDLLGKAGLNDVEIAYLKEILAGG